MKKLKKSIITILTVAILLVSLTACSNSVPTYTKDEASDSNITFKFAITDTNETSIANTSINVVGEDANLIEIMDWYCAENDINFVHDNGLVSVISDLESDMTDGWLLYVNDEMSMVGAAEYIPADGDNVEWKYVNYAEEFE